ncbi:MAG: alpha/beta fold hydrolase [Rhodospirillales bacterium]|nr:alpha/beta fold hydrolase [Rhodospirillales bacterium]
MALRPLFSACLAVLIGLLAACHPAFKPDPQGLMATEGPYTYPRTNPYAATVGGTPEQEKVILPREIPIAERELRVFPERRIPDVLWYEDTFRYSLAAQPGEAPLIFLIAGTNAGHNSRISTFLQKVFYVAGFHVVSLASPTYPNFIVTASSTSVPGRTGQDAEDLHRVMRVILAELKHTIAITDVSLSGYSLGAWDSAFVAELDDHIGAFGFRKVLLINPPVSLYRSSRVLDAMLENNLPGGIEHLDAFLNHVLARFTAVYQRAESVDLSQDFLYRAYFETHPSDQELAALVGISFRLSSTNIAFTADVMTKSGYIVPQDRILTVSSSLSPYFDEGMHRGFARYLDDLLYPYYAKRVPGLTKDDMIAESSLERIEPFLARAQNVGLVTNADDIILAKGDIDFLRRTFATRAQIFPAGGHCGNIQDAHVIAAMVRFLTE